MVREGRVLIPGNSGGDADFGSGFLVTAYSVGAQVASSSSGTTIQVRAGHGFQAGYKLIVWPAAGITLTAITTYRIVESVTSTSIDVTEPVSVSQGEFLVNLGTDNGTFTPQYNGSRATVYTTMSYTTTLLSSTMATDSGGRYRYFHKGIPRWELVRTSTGAPYALYLDSDGQADEDLVSYQVRYAHLFATSGTGTEADPWVTAGSNPVQAAVNDLPVSGEKGGGVVRLIPGVYSIDGGPNGNGVEITNASKVFGNITIEGTSAGGRREESSALAYDDAVVLKYSGSKAAIKVGHWATNRDFWCENVTLRGFKILQTGTTGTGIGIMARLFRFGLFSDLKVNNFSTCIALSGVSDFNEFHNVSVRNMAEYGIDVGRGTDENGAAFGALAGECNANRFWNCDFLSGGRGNGATAWGLYIHGASVNNTVAGCQFHDFDTPTYGAINIQTGTFDSHMTVVRDCYMEGNAAAINHNNPAGSGVLHASGLLVTGNYIAQIEEYGVRVNSGDTGPTYGVVITGNSFILPTAGAPYASARAIQLGTYVLDFEIGSNVYLVQDTRSHTFPNANINHGAFGTLTEDHISYGSKRIIGSLFTTGAATITGNLTLTAGTVTGDITTTGNITSGGHLQGLLQTYTISSATPTIPHGGRHMIDITCNFGGANAPTLAAPSSNDGKLLILRCVALTSGTFSIATGGTVKLNGGTSWTPNADDTIMFAASGSIWYELSRSPNA